MTDVNVQDFPISNLEYVFTPPGLPLIDKTSDTAPTTSILIRGGAGTGKTTLGVALAHAISKANGGVTLHLTTEFAATELAYKVDALDLPEGALQPWSAALESSDAGLPPGTIFAQHLLMTDAGADHERLKTVGRRKLATIDAAWELLAREPGRPSAELPHAPPVRAVVIDAFGLPEVEDEDKELRTKLLELIQAFELLGITTIVIEEASVRSEAWLPFVVDIVFELELATDIDTGDLLRKLRCTKSRYGRALPGPHDYGVDERGLFAVWPDLTVIADAHETLWSYTHPSPVVLLAPPGNTGEFALLGSGSVLVSYVSAKGEDAPDTAFRATPGLLIAHVMCGPLIEFASPGKRDALSQDQGVFALAWMLIRFQREGHITAVHVMGAEFFLEQPRTRIRFLRAISMLARAGLTVCINGSEEGLRPLYPIADFIQRGERGGKFKPTPDHLDKLSYRCDRWIAAGLQLSDLIDIDSYLRSEFKSSSIRYHLLIGKGATAAKYLFGLDNYSQFLELWSDFCAIYAGNPHAKERLAKLASESRPYEAIMLLRALARHGPKVELDRQLEQCANWFNLPEWFQTRLRCELALDSWHDDIPAEAVGELERLAESEVVPQMHRVEILYNLGTIATRQHDQPRAAAYYDRAKALEPQPAF